jgi:Leucine-rich repeat (LRR) protein
MNRIREKRNAKYKCHNCAISRPLHSSIALLKSIVNNNPCNSHVARRGTKLYLWISNPPAMKFRQFKIFVVSLFIFHGLHAQNVLIPDTNFVIWLNANGFASCMNGSRLDTLCPLVLHDTSVNVSYTAITNLNGIQYFKSLRTLITTNSPIYSIPILPDSVTTIICEQNQLVDLPALPTYLRYLDCNSNFLTYLPYLPASLTYLDCSENQITSLPFLPNNLVTFYCFGNRLAALNNLPDSLRSLNCQGNSIRTIPRLPAYLDSLICSYNLIAAIDSLPDSLTYMDCSYNALTALGGGQSLSYLACDSNYLTSLPALYSSLQYLDCHYNQLTQVPALPPLLNYLDCSFNAIDSLPALDSLLQYLTASHNLLQTLPSLPQGLSNVSCGYNLLTSLPALPDSMYSFDCDSNAALYCLPEINTIVTFNFLNTGITCVPDTGNVTVSYPDIDTMPICDTVYAGGICGVINAIENISAPHISLYPNPAGTEVWMDLSVDLIGATLNLLDMTGRTAFGALITSPHFSIPLAGLGPGVYLVEITGTDGNIAWAKLERQ